ncbi:MAG: exodeoxyribonuclease VII small subunit, partial [Endomicrobiia bacterium]
IVEKLESEEVSLEEAISLFEEGQNLINFCNKKLEEVKHKVEIVLKTNTGFNVKPFLEEEDLEEK